MAVIRRKIIVVAPDAIDKMCKSLGVCRALVYNALRGRSNSETAVNIRRHALNEYGGIITKEVKIVNERPLC